MADTSGASEGRDRAPVPGELRDRTDYLLCKVSEAVKRLSNDAFRSFGIRSGHHAVLRSLDAAGPLSQQQLASRLEIDPSTVVALVDHLEDRELVERRRSRQDRRVSLVGVTSAGRTLLHDVEPVVREIQHRAFGRLSERDHQHLRDLLFDLGGPTELGAGVTGHASTSTTPPPAERSTRP